MGKIILFEEFKGDPKNMPYPEHILLMDKLYERLTKEVMVLLPNYKINYVKGKIITIKNNNEKDLNINIFRDNDKISVSIKPQKGPIYEFLYDINEDSINRIYDAIEQEIKNTNFKEEKYLKPYKDENSTSNLISIDVIKDVLNDMFIIEDKDMNKILDQMILKMKEK